MIEGNIQIIAAGLAWLAFASIFPRQGVWLLLLWIPVQGWFQLNMLSDSNLAVLIYEFQMVGLYAIFAIHAMRSASQYGPPPMVWLAVPFAVWTLVLVPFSLEETGLLLTLVGLRTLLLPIPLVWLGYRAFQTRGQLENVSVLLALQAVLIGAVTASQFTSLSSMSGRVFETPLGYIDVGVLRPPGTFAHPGHLGNFILFGIPFAIGLLGLYAPAWKRVCFALGLAGATVALVVNTQRAVLVLLVVILPLTVLIARRGQVLVKWTAALGIMVVAGGLIGVQVAGYALEERLASISEDFQTTLVFNPVSRLADAMQTPAIGGGLGIASPGVGRLESGPVLTPTMLRGESIKFGESFMAFLVYETGVPGLLLFYLFIGAMMYHSFKALRACRGTDMELLAAALFCFELAIVLYSWPYGPLRTPPARVHFWFWAGVLFSLPRLATARPAARDSVAPLRGPGHRIAAIMAQRPAAPHVPAARRRVG